MNDQIQIRLTPQIIKRGVRFFWRSCYLRPLELFLTGVVLFLFIVGDFANGDKPWKGVVVECFLAWPVLWVWVLRIKNYFQMLNNKMEWYHCLSDGLFTLQITDEAIIVGGAEERVRIEWREVVRVIESEEFLVPLWKGWNIEIIPIAQLHEDVVRTIRQKMAKRKLASSILEEIDRYKKWVRRVYLRTAVSCGLLMLLLPIAGLGFLLIWVYQMGHLEVSIKPGKYELKVLDLQSRTDYFSERLEVLGPGELNVSLRLSKSRIGGSTNTQPDDGKTDCEVVLILRTSANTSWHSEIGGGLETTTLHGRLTVTNARTNLAGFHEKGVPLTLGDIRGEQIELCVK